MADKKEEGKAAKTVSLQQILRQQDASYGFLARVLRKEVDDELLAQMRKMKLPASTGNRWLDRGYRELVSFLNTSWERTRGELAADFAHTFIGVSTEIKNVAFPYESVYTSPEHLLMQDSRDEVLAEYRKAKVVLDEDVGEPEDHIAFELEFMQIIGERAADALDAGEKLKCIDLLETRSDFTDEHLLNWVYNFNSDVHRIAQTKFYRAIADILVGVIEIDREILDEALGKKSPNVNSSRW